MNNLIDVTSFPAGAVIFRAGDPGESAYIIEAGEVDVVIDGGGQKVTRKIGRGQLFGEMALIDGGARTASVIAKTDVVLHAISRTQLLRHVDSSDDIVGFLLKVVLMRYRQALRQLMSGQAGDSGVGESSELALPESLRAVEQLELETELNRAIANAEFDLFYQPLVSLADARLIGFEALLRWRSPKRGLVSPGLFIPLAEETGLIVPICRWALPRAANALKAFQETARRVDPNYGNLVMSVNVTKHQIDDLATLDVIDKIFADGIIKRGQLKVELTEGVLMDDFAHTDAWIKTLREKSILISVDDFGTGYSSLGYLHKFTIDELKIDRSFVITMLNDRKSMEIVRAVIGLARGLGLKIVAEGVEEPAQAACLRNMGADFGQGMGADYGQGYGFCKPAEEAVILDMIKTRGLYFHEFMDKVKGAAGA